LKITDITICPVKIARKEGFAVWRGRYDYLYNVLVKIQTDEGIAGYGEAAPIANYFGETQKAIVKNLQYYFAPALIGKDPLNIRECIFELDNRLPGNPCSKAGLDIALHDIKGKALGLSISSLLGGRLQTKIPLACSVGLDKPEKMKTKIVAARDEGYTVIKLKGGDIIPRDLENLRIAREAIGFDGPWLRLDANGGYINRAEVFRYIPDFESLKLILLEQPFPYQEWEATRSLRDRIRIPILLDESLQTAWDFRQLVSSPEGFVANIKVQKNGGLFKASQMVEIAQQFQIPVMIGSQRESHIGNTASIHLASIINCIDYPCDVRYSWSVREDSDIVDKKPNLTNGQVDVPEGPGLGIDVLWDKCDSIAMATYKISN